jgi:hypothetical protein
LDKPKLCFEDRVAALNDFFYQTGGSIYLSIYPSIYLSIYLSILKKIKDYHSAVCILPCVYAALPPRPPPPPRLQASDGT